MDGTMDVESQIRLMRTVIGRKYLEMDDFIDKCASSPGDAEIYEALIDLLKNDVKGYKALISDMESGNPENSGNYRDIGSLTEREVGLYNDIYLPMLNDSDFQDETLAMSFKGRGAQGGGEDRYVTAGRAALSNSLVIDLMSRNDEIASAIGKMVLAEPELASALEDGAN